MKLGFTIVDLGGSKRGIVRMKKKKIGYRELEI